MPLINKSFVGRNFEKAARTYDDNSRLQRRVAKELLSHTKKFDGKILDIGCGTGYIEQATSWDVVGLDLSAAMCEQNNVAVNADAEKMPFQDNSFDNIVSSLTMQWASSYDDFAAEAYRVLKPKGKVAISVFTTGSLQELANSFAYIDDDQHVLKFPASMLLFAVFKKAGFKKLSIHSQKISYLYDDIFKLMGSIKNIGASYSFDPANKGLKGKSYFTKLENIYRSTYEVDGQLSVTWQTLYLTGEK